MPLLTTAKFAFLTFAQVSEAANLTAAVTDLGLDKKGLNSQIILFSENNPQ